MTEETKTSKWRWLFSYGITVGLAALLISLVVDFGVNLFGKLTLLLLCMPLGGCKVLSSGCEDAVLKETASPHMRYTATVYERDCGATTDFSTIVNLRERSVRFKGDSFGPFIVKGRHNLEVSWETNTKLRLECKDCRSEDVFREDKGVEGC